MPGQVPVQKCAAVSKRAQTYKLVQDSTLGLRAIKQKKKYQCSGRHGGAKRVLFGGEREVLAVEGGTPAARWVTLHIELLCNRVTL